MNIMGIEETKQFIENNFKIIEYNPGHIKTKGITSNIYKIHSGK